MELITLSNQDFKTLREGGYYYVDKSLLIDDILFKDPNGTFLFTRPRRFGKSMNLSMLDAFFNIEYKGNTWFDGLAISEKTEYSAYRNAFPVVRLDFKTPLCISFDTVLSSFSMCISDVIDSHRYLLQSDRLDDGLKQLFKTIDKRPRGIDILQSALRSIIRMLRIHHGAKVVVLIDEYDGPMNETYGNPISENVRMFFRSVYSSVLKGNDDVQLCVLTGIMQVARETIFSGLNNIVVNDILSSVSCERFGFTDTEVKQICDHYGHPEKYAEAKYWYEGYRFGNKDVYNPLSVMGYVSNSFHSISYWTDSSGNDILDRLIVRADGNVWENLRALGKGESVNVPIDTKVVFEDIDRDPRTIYSVLEMTGYLKQSDGGVSIPNNEIRMEYSRRILVHMGLDSNVAFTFIDAVIGNDVQKMKTSLESLLDNSNGRMFNDEHSYQAFVTAFLMCSRDYNVTADLKGGDGYYDIRMERIVGEGPDILLEMKKVGGLDILEERADDAIAQIRSKEYYRGLKGEIILYGIAFCGTDVEVRSETAVV